MDKKVLTTTIHLSKEEYESLTAIRDMVDMFILNTEKPSTVYTTLKALLKAQVEQSYVNLHTGNES